MNIGSMETELTQAKAKGTWICGALIKKASGNEVSIRHIVVNGAWKWMNGRSFRTKSNLECTDHSAVLVPVNTPTDSI